MKLSHLLLYSLFVSSLFAANDKQRPEQIPNPIREASFEERMEIQEMRAEREKKPQAKSMAPLNKGLNFTTHMGAFHHPLHISPLGELITTEDGAIWSVYYTDRFKTYNWLTTDALKVTPNHAWFSTYQFRLTNLNTSESVEVNLIENPVFNGIYTHWIIAIDYASGQLCLEDGSIWNLSGFDFAVYKKWLLNDTIVIGSNDGIFAASKPNILINCNITGTPYAEARCVN